MEYIYLDHAAATPVWPEAKAKTTELLETFGNPGSKHRLGVEAKLVWADALKNLANALGCQPNQLIVSSGATESINQVFFGSRLSQGDEIIISSVEHAAVFETAHAITKSGKLALKIVPVNELGQVNQEEFEKALSPKTKLVSLIAANNEYGTVLKISRLLKIVRKFERQNHTKILVHADAAQLLPWHKISLGSLDVDLLSFSGSKLGAGHRAGGLFVRQPNLLQPLISGGGQQRGLRSGTEDIIGATCLSLALEKCWQADNRVEDYRQILEKGLLQIPGTRINGDPNRKLPNIISISTPIEANRLVYALDAAGLAISAGAACSAASSSDQTRVLRAIGLDEERARRTVRISLGHSTTVEEVEAALKIIREAIDRLAKDTDSLNKIKKVGQKLNREYADKDDDAEN